MREIQLPISKSIANRILILQAMRGLSLHLPHEEEGLCDDVVLLRDALMQLRTPQVSYTLDVQNCGTAMRFLTAFVAVQEGLDVVLTGTDRMQERPIGQLVEVLQSVGADITYLGEAGFPPLHIKGKTIERKPLVLNDGESSQFVSALMLVGFPVETNDNSPYIQMTQEIMENLQDMTSAVWERDWSAASYWYEYVALYGGTFLFPDLYFQTLQGDVAVAEIFESLGIKTEETDAGMMISRNPSFKRSHYPIESPLHVDFADCPDLFPAVYVTCHTLGIPLKARGTERLPHKESNRLKAFEQLDTRGKGQAYGVMSSYNDHRVAMALLVAGYQVDDTTCISKSYPTFIEHLRNVTFVVPYGEQALGVREKQAKTDKHILYIYDEGKGKKWALRKGIEQARTDYVWLTDIDVERKHYPIFIPPMADLYILPLCMESAHHSGLVRLQQVEYLAIQALTLWMAEKGKAVMCSGANLIAHRAKWLSSYEELHPNIPSGDDMFLLESFKRKKYVVKTLYDPIYQATVQPQLTWKGFLKQRMRWAGKAWAYKDKDIILCGMLTFIANLLVLLCPILVLVKYPFDWHIIRRAADYGLLTPASMIPHLHAWSLLLAIVYPIYMLVALIGGVFRINKW